MLVRCCCCYCEWALPPARVANERPTRCSSYIHMAISAQALYNPISDPLFVRGAPAATPTAAAAAAAAAAAES